LVTAGAEVEEDEPTIVLMSMHQECTDLTHDDSDRSAHEASIIEVDLTINSDDDRSGNPMQVSPARLIADNSLPSINPGDKEFFNLITLPINIKSSGVESSFWVVVGGEHSGDIVDSLDEATLRTTATTMALCGEHHPDGFAIGLENMELACDWHGKLYKSLLSNGWAFSTSMSAREIQGSCWVRRASRNPEAEADDEEWRKLPCVPLPPFTDHDPTDLGPYFPKGRLVPYSDSDSSTDSKQSAGSRKNLKKKEKRITKGNTAGVTQRTKKPNADIGLPELIDSSESESDTNPDEDGEKRSRPAGRGGLGSRWLVPYFRGGPPRSIKHAVVDPDPNDISKAVSSSDLDTVHARAQLQSTSGTSSVDSEHRALGRNRPPCDEETPPPSDQVQDCSNEDGPFTRGVDRDTHYDDMPPLHSDDEDAGPPIRGAIRGVATMNLSPDEKA
jgi:hypothetical protein